MFFWIKPFTRFPSKYLASALLKTLNWTFLSYWYGAKNGRKSYLELFPKKKEKKGSVCPLPKMGIFIPIIKCTKKKN
jgi:hypothetical protein